MATEIRRTDTNGRLKLPKGFALTRVVIEQISETELCVRKADVIPEDELLLEKEARKPLSMRDRKTVLQLLNNPPKPVEPLKQAMQRYRKRRV